MSHANLSAWPKNTSVTYRQGALSITRFPAYSQALLEYWKFDLYLIFLPRRELRLEWNIRSFTIALNLPQYTLCQLRLERKRGLNGMDLGRIGKASCRVVSSGAPHRLSVTVFPSVTWSEVAALYVTACL